MKSLVLLAFFLSILFIPVVYAKPLRGLAHDPAKFHEVLAQGLPLSVMDGSFTENMFDMTDAATRRAGSDEILVTSQELKLLAFQAILATKNSLGTYFGEDIQLFSPAIRVEMRPLQTELADFLRFDYQFPRIKTLDWDHMHAQNWEHMRAQELPDCAQLVGQETSGRPNSKDTWHADPLRPDADAAFFVTLSNQASSAYTDAPSSRTLYVAKNDVMGSQGGGLYRPDERNIRQVKPQHIGWIAKYWVHAAPGTAMTTRTFLGDNEAQSPFRVGVVGAAKVKDTRNR